MPDNKTISQGDFTLHVPDLNEILLRSTFPSDFAIKEDKASVYKRQEFQISEIIKGLRKLSLTTDVSIEVPLLAGVGILLKNYTNHETLILGIAGAHLNDDPSYVIIPGSVEGKRVFDLMQEINVAFLESQLSSTNDADTSKITNSIKIAIEFIKSGSRSKKIESANIIFQFHLFPELVSLRVEYNASMFDLSTIKRIGSNFLEVLKVLTSATSDSKCDFNIVCSEEISLIDSFNNTYSPIPYTNFVKIFEEQAKKAPGLVALRYQDAFLSYEELDHRSTLVALELRRSGAPAQSIIGVILERSLEMMVAILGIMKAGCAYLPIDPRYPTSRIEYILADSKTSFLLTSQAVLKTLDVTHIKVICFEKLELHDDPPILPPFEINPESLAYVIYTSASTGNPKGVMIRHRNLVNFIFGMQEKISFCEGESLLMLAPISFDLSISETMLPLACGVTVVIATEEEQKDPYYFNDVIVKKDITLVHCTPSRLKAFMSDENCTDWMVKVEKLMVGGEAFPVEVLDKLRAKFTGSLYNLYGPTETTVWSTFKDLTSQTSINIGKPLRNTSIHILNKSDQLVPIGVPGELCIGGLGVAAGYLNNINLTSERFVPNPFQSNSIMYRTGDFAKWCSSGDIEFLGRIDSQVKVRGYRVELGEIELRLLEQENISDAKVLVKEDRNFDKFLCAYVIGKGTIDFKNLKETLFTKLPSYMVPSFFSQLKEFPCTPNGKLDLKSFPAPDHFETVLDNSSQDQQNLLRSNLLTYPGIEDVLVKEYTDQARTVVYFIAASNVSTFSLRKFLFEQGMTIDPTLSFMQVNTAEQLRGVKMQTQDFTQQANVEFEKSVSNIWQNALGGRIVLPDDNFIDLGGNSLQIITVMAKMEKELNIRPAFQDFFGQSLRQFSAVLLERKEKV